MPLESARPPPWSCGTIASAKPPFTATPAPINPAPTLNQAIEKAR